MIRMMALSFIILTVGLVLLAALLVVFFGVFDELIRLAVGG
jgi:hypothetical protein